jgi:hypothetical protein
MNPPTLKALSLILLFCTNQYRTLLAQQNPEQFLRQAEVLEQMLQKFHFSPVTVNTQVSEEIFESVFEKLDPYG